MEEQQLEEKIELMDTDQEEETLLMFWSMQWGIQELSFQGCSLCIVKPRICTLNIVSLESYL